MHVVVQEHGLRGTGSVAVVVDDTNGVLRAKRPELDLANERFR